MAEESHFIALTDIVGAAASVIGLGLTIYLLRIARDVKSAVERAREDALSTTRKRSLVEDLEDVRRMVQQVGNLIQQEEWLAVRHEDRGDRRHLQSRHGQMGRRSAKQS